MNEKRPLRVVEKALRVNLDPFTYGTIAEIGAGQEVARNFFLAGAAAGTVAKTMSAYDMQVSDAIYGEEPDHRYVSRSRVRKMVDREYGLVVQRLEKVRPKGTKFFAFADTAVAKGYNVPRDCHCWMGIKMQLEAGGEASSILLHVRMKDNSNRDQQEALGAVGVNLIYGAFYEYLEPDQLIASLTDGLEPGRVEIDMIKFEGPGFQHIDNRLMALHLVKIGHAPAVFFTHEGDPIQALDLLYKKNVLLFRGSFRPFTNVHMDIFNSGRERFALENPEEGEQHVDVTEISMHSLMNEGNIDEEDFLGRVNILCNLGFNVLISNTVKYYELKAYLRQITYKKIAFMMGVRKLEGIFDDIFYEELRGGILEGLSILFSGETLMYVYPKYEENGQVITLDKMHVKDHMKHLFVHFLANKRLVPLKSLQINNLSITRKQVAREIKEGKDSWREKVPDIVYNDIVAKKLFDFPG
jgi:hypothetical protein